MAAPGAALTTRDWPSRPAYGRLDGMSEPTDLPFQDDEHRPESIYEGERPGENGAGRGHGAEAGGTGRSGQDVDRSLTPGTTRLGRLGEPEETETDVLAARVTGPEDHDGMTQLWRATMGLGHWWFVAVGETGAESPAAAQIDGQMMLLTFTSAERARHFAVQNEMVGPDEDLRAIALTPRELVDSSTTYADAGIAGLMFDPHLSGYFIPTDQLPVVWDAVNTATDAPNDQTS